VLEFVLFAPAWLVRGLTAMSARPINIVFCTRGGIHGALVLRRLLTSPRVRLCGIVYSSRVAGANDGFFTGVRRLLRQSGLAYLLYLWCSTSLAEWLMRFSRVQPVSTLAAKNRIPIRTTPRINDESSRQFIAGLKPDLLVSAFFNQHIGDAIAAIPTAGAVNIHPSVLPGFKGVDPAFFAALCEGETGVTVHRVSRELDGGNILRQESIAADPHDSVLKTTARLYDRGGELLVGILDDIAGGMKGTVQTAAGHYDSWPAPAQVRELKSKCKPLVSLRDLIGLARSRMPADPA
jgi:methionyl-tRNA formyltransferase